MIKVAIAGAGGLAQLIARHVDEETSHQFVILSRRERPTLNDIGFQVIVVDYDDSESLKYALAGVDTVISTVPGLPQLNLIDAAVACGVRRFAPAEFEGSPTLRPVDTLDRLRATALERLRLYANRLESTAFVCGIFYERFAPGGMRSLGIGVGSGMGGEGEYLVDIRSCRAKIPYDPSGRAINICLTSADDVAKFVVRALDLPSWPAELSMCGDRMCVLELVQIAESIKGQRFETAVQTADALTNSANHYRQQFDFTGEVSTQSLLGTLEGRYDFIGATLNGIVDFVPVSFGVWLRQIWAECI